MVYDEYVNGLAFEGNTLDIAGHLILSMSLDLPMCVLSKQQTWSINQAHNIGSPMQLDFVVVFHKWNKFTSTRKLDYQNGYYLERSYRKHRFNSHLMIF